MKTYILSDIFQGEYQISQKYGENAVYYRQFGLKGHEGVDWATPVGVPVLAPFEGIVLRDGDYHDRVYGNFLVIWDPKQQCAVWLCHLKENYVYQGQRVKKGDVIGRTGNTGNSSGPHLHVNFVETDAYGNRLNMNNGYQGFINILGSNVVWQLASTVTPLTTEQKLSKVIEIIYGTSSAEQKIAQLKSLLPK